MLDCRLRLAPLEMAFGIELPQPLLNGNLRGSRFLIHLIARAIPAVSDVINPPTAALRPLSISIVGYHQRAVALNDQISRLETIRIVFLAGGKFQLGGPLKSATARTQWIAHHRFAPLAKQQ